MLRASMPSMRRVPVVGVSNNPMQLSSVVFPHPDGPVKAVMLPGHNARLSPCQICRPSMLISRLRVSTVQPARLAKGSFRDALISDTAAAGENSSGDWPVQAFLSRICDCSQVVSPSAVGESSVCNTPIQFLHLHRCLIIDWQLFANNISLPRPQSQPKEADAMLRAHRIRRQ